VRKRREKTNEFEKLHELDKNSSWQVVRRHKINISMIVKYKNKMEKKLI
jgi:hypothetical protein